MALFCALPWVLFLLVLRQMKTSPRIKIAITAIPPTAPPAMAPIGNEDFAAGAEVGVVDVDDDEEEVVVEGLPVDVSSSLSALVTILEAALACAKLVTVAGL